MFESAKPIMIQQRKINITQSYLTTYEYVQILQAGMKQIESQCEYPVKPAETAEETLK